jgi:GxxExxY protein
MMKHEITERIIGAAIEDHRALGPGLLESAYEEYLEKELTYLKDGVEPIVNSYNQEFSAPSASLR